MSSDSAEIEPGFFGRNFGPGVPISRRAFLGMSALALGAVLGIDRLWNEFMQVDTALGQAIWRPTQAQLVEFEPFSPEDQQHPWLTEAGLGHASSLYLARQVHGMDPAKINPAYPVIPNQGTTLPSTAEVSLPLFRKAKTVNILGSSMGGPVSLEIARHAAAKGAQAPLDTLVLVSSPFGMEDARMHVAARIIDELHMHANLRGGPFSKGITNLIQNWQNDNWDPIKLWPELKKLPYDATHGNSPAVWVSQIAMLDQIDLWKNREAYKGVITPNTRWYYVCSEDSRMDRVVDVDAAIRKYQKIAHYLGATMQIVRVPGMAHADMQTASPYIAEKINYGLVA